MEPPIHMTAEAVVSTAQRMAAAAGYDQCEGVSNILLTAVFYHAAMHIRDQQALRAQMAAAGAALREMADGAAGR